MTGAEAINRIQSIAAGNAAALKALATEIAQDANDAPRAVVDVWLQGRPPLSYQAGAVALGLDDLTLAAILHSAAKLAPGGAASGLRTATELYDRLRRRTVRRLSALLQDVTAWTASSQPDASGQARRVCDQAYVLIRRLLRVADSREGGFRTEQEFLQSNPTERGEEIRRWVRSPSWTAYWESGE